MAAFFWAAFVGFVGVFLLLYSKLILRTLQPATLPGVAQQTIVSGLHKTFWQDMQGKPVDKLIMAHPHLFADTVLPIIFVMEVFFIG